MDKLKSPMRDEMKLSLEPPTGQKFTRTKDVTWIREAGLCMGCGACESICPVPGAISLEFNEKHGEYLPVVDPQICTECTACLMTCPGERVDFSSLANEFIGGQINDPLVGMYDRPLLGYARSQPLRYFGTSGGVATALLLHLLKEGKIDGALVLGTDDQNPLRTRPILARTPQEILSAIGSKYLPSSINTGLAEIIHSEGRFAVVGLPCNLHAVRKMELMKRSLRKKIVLHIGLFCANNNTSYSSEYFLKANAFKPEDITGLRFRSNGWPGMIEIGLKNGNKYLIDRRWPDKKHTGRSVFSSAYHFDFMLPRCLLCPDQTAELADISLGDPWLPELMYSERVGISLILVRNQAGQIALDSAVETGDIVLEELPKEKLYRSQDFHMKASVGSRIWVRKLLGKAVPNYGDRSIPIHLSDILEFRHYLPTYFSHKKWTWPFIRLNGFLRYMELSLYQKLHRKKK